jgi:outer membrane protein assembly factor BamB
LWKCGDDEAAYSSFMIATLAGTRQVVAFTADALLGAALETGQILWRIPLKTNAKRHAASPVIFDDFVLVNSHSIGLVCFHLEKDSGGFKAASAWTNLDLKINLATPVLVDGYLYSQGADKDYVCVEAKTGKVAWSQAGFGLGRKDYASTIAAGKSLLVLTAEVHRIGAPAGLRQHLEPSRLCRRPPLRPRRARVAMPGSDAGHSQKVTGRSLVRSVWLASMFDLIKEQLTTATEKLAHLRRFL